jgi:hypothetical protein
MTALRPAQGPLRPRRTTHRGVVDVEGYWFMPTPGTPEALELRVLSVWLPGADISRLGAGYIVRLRAPRRIAVAACPAAPLVREAGILTSAPLLASERRILPEGTELVLVEAGAARTPRRSELDAVDAADWIDVSRFLVCEARALGELSDLPLKLVAADTKALFDRKIGRTAADHEQQRELLAALDSAQTEERARGRAASRVLGFLRTTLVAMRRWAQSELRSGHGKSRRHAPSSPKALAVYAPPSIWQRMQVALARWVGNTRLMSFLARKQAVYLRELFELLDAHDDMEALRRAIPLGKGEKPGAPYPALAPPTPRSSFDISTGARTAGPSTMLGGGLYEELRRAYESVFQRLDKSGKHEEAAFVLAEILNEPERAVAYLEQQGRLKLAAEVAEARNLAPGLVVRLWFLAGNHQRAVAIAVRENAFEPAIARLEQSGKRAEADALRLLQAERLADGGRYVAAARLAQKITMARLVVLQWLALARAAGDLNGVALELALDMSRFEPVRVALEPLRAESSPDGVRLRATIAEDFMRMDAAVGKPLARELVREMLVDAAQLGDSFLASVAGRVAAWIGGAFDADQPTIVAFTRRTPTATVRYRYAAEDCGSRPIFDAHPCGTRFLLALGEAGVVLVNRAGKDIARFDLPAEHLVTTDDGTRVLTVAHRGRALRVGRLDLATRRSDNWGEVHADAFARTFDGQTWVVLKDGWSKRDESELLVLDAVDESPTILRRLEVPIGAAGYHCIEVDERHCNLVGSEPFGPLERMRFELPTWTLRERKKVELEDRPEDSIFTGAWTAIRDQSPVVYSQFLDREAGTVSAPRLRRGELEVPLPPDIELGKPPPSIRAHGDYFALAIRGESGARVLIGNFATRALLLDIELEGTKKPELRLTDNRALVCDDLGRLLIFDLAAVRCIHDLRL